jgi:putative tricarboxylic transport membrane protein
MMRHAAAQASLCTEDFKGDKNVKRNFLKASLALAVAAIAGVGVTPALAQVDTLKMMIPAGTGGGWDQTGRNLAAAMQSANVVKNVQFENKGGAAGTIGLAQFANSAKGDANAVLIGGQVMVGGIVLNKSPVNLTMVTPLARLTSEYLVVVVPANSKLQNMKDLTDALKANPGAVAIGGGSAGGTDHQLAGIIAGLVGVEPGKVNYVPFAGGGEAQNAILGGHVTAGISGLGEFAEQIKAGKLRALAVSSPSRISNIPTLKEQGLDVEFGNWRGIFGAPGITPQQRDALVEVIKKSLDTPAWKGTLERLGWTPVPLYGDEFKKFLDADIARSEKIVGTLGLKK